jgi:hypothetical protein
MMPMMPLPGHGMGYGKVIFRGNLKLFDLRLDPLTPPTFKTPQLEVDKYPPHLFNQNLNPSNTK